MPVVPEKVSLIDGLYGPHEWGYRCPVEGGFIADDRPYRAADRIALLEEALRPFAKLEVPGGRGVGNAGAYLVAFADITRAAQALAETEVPNE